MSDDKALRLKVYFENNPKIERVIDIETTGTLEDLHLTILAAFDFNAGEMASFWMVNDLLWLRTQEIPMIRVKDEITGEESASMEDVKTIDVINVNRKALIYEYDMLLMWVLRIEYLDTVDKIASMAYPVLVAESGKVPNADQARIDLLEENSP